MTLEKEIFPAATDSRFIRAVSIRTGYDSMKDSHSVSLFIHKFDIGLDESYSTPSVLCPLMGLFV